MVELVKRGAVDLDEVRRYLGTQDDALVGRFTDLVTAAESEPD